MNQSTKNVQWATITANDARWAAVVARDPQADGTFYYSVETTGVYCRPSCAARLARPEHVRFHATCTEAEQAGFRPCKRCKPHQSSLVEQQATTIAAACRFIEQSEETPSLAQLAHHVGWSPYHFHRVFKAITGLTPKSTPRRIAPSACGARSACVGTVTELSTTPGTTPTDDSTPQQMRYWG